MMLLPITFAAMLIASSPASTQQTPPAVTKSASASTTATIQAIDSTTRTITLRDDKGQEDVFSVGPQVKRFDELKVGDRVKFTYYESIVMQVRKAGDAASTGGASIGATPAKGAGPGATISAQDKMTVTVKAIDAALPSITVTTPDGRTVTRKVENPKNLEGVKVGDKIDIVYTRALVTSVEPAK